MIAVVCPGPAARHRSGVAKASFFASEPGAQWRGARGAVLEFLVREGGAQGRRAERSVESYVSAM